MTRTSARPVVFAIAAVAAASSLATLSERPARAQLTVLDPVNLVENIISAIQNISAVAQQVEQLGHEATQIYNQVQQLRDMANQAAQGGAPTWGEVQAWIDQLAVAAQIGDSLVYNMPNIANSTNARAASEAAFQQFIGAPGSVANPAASAGGFNP